MSNEISVSNEPPDEPRRAVPGSVGTVFLASVGAFGVAVEKLGGTLDWLVGDETGAEVETRGIVSRAFRWPAKTARSAVRATGQQIDRGLDATLGALNVPRKSDVDRLNERIAELSRKLDEVYNQNGQ